MLNIDKQIFATIGKLIINASTTPENYGSNSKKNINKNNTIKRFLRKESQSFQYSHVWVLKQSSSEVIYEGRTYKGYDASGGEEESIRMVLN